MTAPSVPTAALLAAADQLPEDVGKSGPLGLLITALLAVAVVLLIRSMSGHLKRVPRTFDGTDDVRVPDTPAELVDGPPTPPQPGQGLLDDLRRAPRAIEPPRGDDDRPEGPERS